MDSSFRSIFFFSFIVFKDLHGYRYRVTGAKEGTKFSHSQKVQHGETRGEYRLLLPDDRWQIVSYVADEQGYRATGKLTNH